MDIEANRWPTHWYEPPDVNRWPKPARIAFLLTLPVSGTLWLAWWLAVLAAILGSGLVVSLWEGDKAEA
jgi:hypothetical protein